MNVRHFPLRLLLFAVVTTLVLGLVSGRVGESIEEWGTAFGAHLALGALFALLVRTQPRCLRWVFSVQFMLVFVILVASTAIELFFFSDATIGSLGSFVALGTLASAGYVGLSCALFYGGLDRAVVPGVAEARDPGAIDRLRSHVRTRSAASWTWRVMGGVLSYLLVYILVGAIAFRFTGPYYTDPSYGLELVVPPLGTILAVQVARSLLFAFALWPIVAGLDLTRMQTGALGGIALFALGGLIPLLLNADWPTPLRFYHAVEIFFQNAPAGFAISWLLWSRRGEDRLRVLDPVPA